MKKTLIKCGWLVTLDAATGDFADGELLMHGDRVLAVGKSLDAAHDEVIDASDMIVMPGLINGHIHVWQCGLRGIGSEWMGPDYHSNIHANIATRYGPRDNYLGNFVGAQAQIDSGVTTVIDFCHNLKSLEMAEAAIDGLEETGIRAVFAHGTAKPPAKEGEVPFTHVPHPRDRIEALRKGRMASDDRLVTLAMAVLGPHYGTQEVAEADIRLAREFGLFSTSHATKPNDKCVTPRGYLALARAGLLGPDHNIVHGNYIDDEELKAIVDNGATVTATVLVELHGHAPDPLVMRVRELGGMPSIGIDVEPIVTGEMFREMHAALLHARWSAHRDNEAAGKPSMATMPVRSREALEWATVGNARVMGLDKNVGTLAPGMKADIVMLRANDLNVFPVHDPIYTIVEQAGAKNVDTVIIDGVVRKRGGKLLVDEKLLADRMREMRASAERAMEEASFKVKAA
ncbi:amidohydrolase family protein [Neoaquamicrobium sediminum]|uniref:amidohydrolase family protein n=1 Tax=Neoaquamicrobium sediminum TaxID=1849104 RepID=UPI0015634A61|nr:amidohydrolase family protein [Mesorhizobium sediminum]NRC56869.1 amidohydrolase family protein [Mesorhizobium sediminum]